ncbi:arginyl-tRNA synthetase [Synechococcus sp. PCC 7502]|uniref:arginine--tRNA ligase n=1 Tax=Synechococcus sp. PCC 7502 TaxID=1173263 RepID=UPI00029F9DB7|nr:arginine--tRNA ligase [Synechococcus sp. PCC 7502]AFY74950.1 arginyl-tRNA synthetase [Synechococcus sp. PCC 7502]
MSSSVLAELKVRFQTACVKAFGEEYLGIDPSVSVAKDLRFGDYQCNAALSLSKRLKQKPQAIAAQIIQHLTISDLGEAPSIDGPGFINVKLKPEFLASRLAVVNSGDRLGIEETRNRQRIIVDFSSPNIAKEMHVGHLRSTIIGDCIARILEFQGHEVLRLNHVGDWGTQFGMLITYLKEVYPRALTESDALDLGDLVALYRAAKKRFDEDEQFKEASRLAVVDLQSGQPEATFCWQLLCDQSRREFQKIYDALDIKITERGESFYSPYLASVVEDLQALGLLEKSEGALCVFLDGFTNKEGDRLPLIIQKSDGGYNYATTDLAAIRYRIQEDKAERIIYVTDMGQSSHFEQVFQVARRANWLTDNTKVIHVPFGLVLGEDGKKLKTRSGDTVRLQELLDEAIARVKTDLETRNPEFNDTYKQEVAEAVGLGAVKYADLSQNRTSNYAFSFDKMLSLQGNTAPYMLYAYVRIRGISRKGALDFDSENFSAAIALKHELELALAKHLIQLPEIIDAVSEDLMPNRLCLYLFELSQKFNQFYDQCPVLQAEDSDRLSRLLLCHVTAKTLKLGLGLLGIRVLEKM